MRGRAPARGPRHRDPRRLRRPHHRDGGPGRRAVGAGGDQQGLRGGRHRPRDGPPPRTPAPAGRRGLRRGPRAGRGLMLRLVLPKGSLEKATLQLFADADLAVVRGSDVEYRGTIDDPRVDEVRILRPQEIPLYVADGLFDLGITGRDWIEETGADVVSLGTLAYSKATSNPIRVVLAVARDSPVTEVADLPPGSRVSTEYPELTRRLLEKQGVHA